MELTQKTRSPPFAALEKALLIDILSKFSAIIDCKRTDKVFSEEKDRAWVAIAAQFDAETTSCVQRTVKQLRTCYENLKSTARKNIAKEKV